MEANRRTAVTEDLEAYRRSLVADKYRLAEALHSADDWQERVRTGLLAENADTVFGAEHGFSRIRTMDDYRAAVPLRSAADYEPWVARAADGEPRVLTAEESRVFFTTSGSTGVRKRVPVTARFLTTTYLPFFRAAMGVPAEFFPEVVTCSTATLNLRHDRLTQPATTGSGRHSLGPSQVDMGRAFGVALREPGGDAPWTELPVPVADSAYLDKLYLRIRMAVEHDVRCVIGHNPAMIAMLPVLLSQWWPRLLRDLHDGTYLGAPGARPNPDRAAELERQAAYFGRPIPAVIWPRIRLIYCWTSGVASLYLPRLKELYGTGVTVLPAPTAASEGPVGVPIDRHPTAGPLPVSTALYEFVDADDDIRADSPTLLHHELEAGRDYHVVFSHIGGLYRYVLGDLVHVVDHVHGVPRIEYAGRDTLSDAVGERLREFHLVRALRAAAQCIGLDIENATCRVEPASGTPGYVVAAALRPEPRRGELPALAGAMDGELARLSHRYRTARARGALAAPVIRRVAPEAFVRHWHRRVEAGMRPPEVKDQILQPCPAAWKLLLEE